MLTNRYWRLVSVLSDGVEIINDCKKDNLYVYTASGKYYIHVGSDNCGGGESNSVSSWTFASGETVMDYPSGTDLDILKLDADSLKLSYTAFGVVEVYAH